ncbi:gigasin-6-like [Bradysia coprophila]|uniref:gigasin-6-like n=1 Tax=Bradysia coprophila TaxID=38358 RepID=UPI00187DB0B4|nr:gigasin-6-like [Bradysia coprophila]
MNFSIFTLISIYLIASNFAFDAETERSIDNFVENVFMRNNEIPGVGLSVVRNGTVLISKGYGMRNITAGLTVDQNTLFAIGSTTKSFTAVLVVKTLNELYPERGAAVLDTPIAKLIPPTVNFTLSDRYRAEQTTFRDILAHRTCLLNGGIDLLFGTMTAEEYALYIPQVCEFRNGYHYNNNMVALAGELIAAIAGTTLRNMTLSLARDIGMENTTCIDFDGVYESLPDMSQPYILRNGTLVEFDIFQLRRIHVGLGTGGILSTANDMAKYMEFHLSQGRVGNRQIVPTNVMNWLYTISNGFDFRGSRRDDADSSVYGDLGTAQGFFSALYDGWSVIHHGGYWPPYVCDMCLFPATKIGIFICSNGPGLLMNYPSHEITSVNIFELIRGTNRSLEEIESKNRKFDNHFIEEHLFDGHKANRVSTVLHYSRIRNKVELNALQLYFSEWAHGRLQQVPGSNTNFSVHWDTTIMDYFYSGLRAPLNFWIDFGIVDSVLLRVDFNNLEFQFVKNATLDTFPAIPWSPSSCGPE